MYNLNVQRQLTPTTLLEIGYSGNRGLHLVRSGEANPVINVATRERIKPEFRVYPVDCGPRYIQLRRAATELA